MSGGKSKEQKAKDVPVHFTTMSHNDESPAKQMNSTQDGNEASLRRSIPV